MILKHKNGFTMVEQLLTLMIILTLLPIVQLLVLYLHTPTNQYTVELNGATNAIFQMIVAGYEVEIIGQTLKFKNHKNQIVLIEKYNDLLRRRVGGQGHEILLRHIQTLNLSIKDQMLTIEIIMDNHEQIKKEFYVVT